MRWALRVGSFSRWKGKDAAKAAKDLELREGDERRHSPRSGADRSLA
jgi:hypothetical protein